MVSDGDGDDGGCAGGDGVVAVAAVGVAVVGLVAVVFVVIMVMVGDIAVRGSCHYDCNCNGNNPLPILIKSPPSNE